MALAAFAKKCGIEQKELQADAESLLDILDGMTNEPDNHFKMSDIKVALKAYEKEDAVRWSPRMIEHWTDIEMKKTKRNRRKQTTHLKMARSNRDILSEEKGRANWWEGGGRPEATLENSKVATLIGEWMLSHPDSHNKALCARDLNMSRTTVTKWWKQIEEQGEDYLYEWVDDEVSQDILDSIGYGVGVFPGEDMPIPNFD